MSSLAALLALVVSAPPTGSWLGSSNAKIDFEITSALPVSAGYSIRLPIDAGAPNAIAWWDGGWQVVPIAPDTDPASHDVWFALPFGLDAGEVFEGAAFFGSDLPSPVQPERVFLRYDAFDACSFGTWQRRNTAALQVMDPAVSHRDGGCSARLDASQQNITTLVTPETYQSVAFDVWWMADAPTNMVWGNSFHLQSNALDGYSFGFIQGFGGWVSGRLVNGGSNFNAGNTLVAPAPAFGSWQRVVAYVTPGTIRGCVDGVCVDDTMLVAPGATFDGGSVGLGRRVTNPVSDGGLRAWADDVIARMFQNPEPQVTTSALVSRPDAGTDADAGLEEVDGGARSRWRLDVGCGCSGSGAFACFGALLTLLRRRRAHSSALGGID